MASNRAKLAQSGWGEDEKGESSSEGELPFGVERRRARAEKAPHGIPNPLGYFRNESLVPGGTVRSASEDADRFVATLAAQHVVARAWLLRQALDTSFYQASSGVDGEPALLTNDGALLARLGGPEGAKSAAQELIERRQELDLKPVELLDPNDTDPVLVAALARYQLYEVPRSLFYDPEPTRRLRCAATAPPPTDDQVIEAYVTAHYGSGEPTISVPVSFWNDACRALSAKK